MYYSNNYLNNINPYNQTNFAQQPPQQVIKGRPVSSFEEARASQIDFDGSVFIFPDIANKKIYTKQINLDGTSSIHLYELNDDAIQTPQQFSQNYVTKEEFESTVSQLQKILDDLKNCENKNNITQSFKKVEF